MVLRAQGAADRRGRSCQRFGVRGWDCGREQGHGYGWSLRAAGMYAQPCEGT